MDTATAMAPTHSERRLLPYTTSRLERAERVVDAQWRRPRTGREFGDHLPYIYDVVAAIGRTCETEIAPVCGANQGLRAYWDALERDAEFVWLRKTGRNGELKANERTTRIETIMRGSNGTTFTVHDIGITQTLPDGSSRTVRAESIADGPQDAVIFFKLLSGPWKNMDVMTAIDGFLRRWRYELLPRLCEFVEATPQPPRSGIGASKGDLGPLDY